MFDPHGRPGRQLYCQFQFATDRFDVAAERREIHVRLVLDLGDGGLFDVQGGRDIFLGLARDLTQLAQSFDLLLEFVITRFDLLLLVAGEGSYNLIDAPSHRITLL